MVCYHSKLSNTLTISEKDQLIRYKFRWSEADEDPQDNRLTMEEFKNFRHPEQSKTMMNHMVKDILSNLGKLIFQSVHGQGCT
jgi:hypothetical protein